MRRLLQMFPRWFVQLFEKIIKGRCHSGFDIRHVPFQGVFGGEVFTLVPPFLVFDPLGGAFSTLVVGGRIVQGTVEACVEVRGAVRT